MWNSVGFALLSEIKLLAKNEGVVQILIVSGAHDKEKHNFLTNQNLSIASEWFVANI